MTPAQEDWLIIVVGLIFWVFILPIILAEITIHIPALEAIINVSVH